MMVFDSYLQKRLSDRKGSLGRRPPIVRSF
nr:MAG TPA: hypothetical protein [Caudoviricetes sp.]